MHSRPFRPGGHESVKGLTRETKAVGQISVDFSSVQDADDKTVVCQLCGTSEHHPCADDHKLFEGKSKHLRSIQHDDIK